jgi:hypothetical protein
MDYYCVVVADCSPTSQGESAYRAALANVEYCFGEVITLEQALATWAKSERPAGHPRRSDVLA